MTNKDKIKQETAEDIWNAVKACISSISCERGKEYDDIVKYYLKDVFEKYGVDINE